MNLAYRLLSLVLVLMLLLSAMPLGALADGEGSDTTQERCAACGEVNCICNDPQLCTTCGKTEEECTCDDPQTCTTCGKTEEECTCDDPQTCTTCGKTEEECTCNDPQTCTTCGKTEEECTCDDPQTCTTCGKTEEECTCNDPQTCTTCGKTEEECTCDDPQTCTTCGKTEEECTCNDPQTCTTCGKTEEECTCDDPQTCTTCGKTEEECTCNDPQTCTTCGKTEEECTCNDPQTCTTCGKTEEECTCDDPQTCTTCGKTEEECTCNQPQICDICGEAMENHTELNSCKLKSNNSLPNYALYETSAGGNVCVTRVTGAPGSTVTLYLVWPEGYDEPDYVATLDDSWQPDRDYITVEEKANTYWKISFPLHTDTSKKGLTIVIRDIDNKDIGVVNLAITYTGGPSGEEGSEYPGMVDVPYGNTTLKVGLAPVVNNMLIINDEGLRTTHDRVGLDGYVQPLYFCAMENYGESDEGLAPKAFYNAVSNVSITIDSECWTNDDGTTDECNFSITEPTRVTLDQILTNGTADITTTGATITAQRGKLCEARIILSFTYDGKTYSSYKYLVYDPSEDTRLEISEDDDLNAILASGKSLADWMLANYPGLYNSFNGGFIDLYLPAKAYDEVIVANTVFPAEGHSKIPYASVRLYGAEGSQRTTMPGMVVNGGVFYMKDIDFMADTTNANIGLELNASGGSLDIYNCAFIGYSCGIDCGGSSWLREFHENAIRNCITGIHLNSPEVSGASNSFISYKYNTFLKCYTAVHIDALPESVSPFRTRVNDNLFLCVNTEFNVQDEGIYYFNQNYSGGKSADENKGMDYWNNLSEEGTNRERHGATIAKGSKVKVVTNPVMKSYKSNSNTYWIYSGIDQYSAIFNSSASSVLIDSNCFTQSNTQSQARSTEQVQVSILDDNGNEIALWNITKEEAEQ